MAGRPVLGWVLAVLALRPAVVEFIDAALTRQSLAFGMEEVLATPGGQLVGKTIGELRSEGVLTMAILREGGSYEATPPDGRVVEAGELLIVSGVSEALDRLGQIAPIGRNSGDRAGW